MQSSVALSSSFAAAADVPCSSAHIPQRRRHNYARRSMRLSLLLLCCFVLLCAPSLSPFPSSCSVGASSSSSSSSSSTGAVSGVQQKMSPSLLGANCPYSNTSIRIGVFLCRNPSVLVCVIPRIDLLLRMWATHSTLR